MVTKNRNYISAADYAEEESKLNELVRKVSDMLANPEKYLPYPEVSPYQTAWDYDEGEDLHFKKQANKNVIEGEIEPWSKSIDSPYFGRLDLEINGEFKTVYIGNKDLWINSNSVVISGYSKVGSFFLQSTMPSSRVDGNDYTALLRRKLIIEQKKLTFAEDLYVVGEDSKYKGITDPYLLEVLKRNRKEKGMTSILSSIQENQFNIVRMPTTESFIVQGCAGSGKTAIIFQRFANIQYNSPKYINDRVRFITPNSSFNSFIDPLTRLLDLQKIKPITIIDYYFELFSRYKINANVKSNEVHVDEELPDKLIKEIYSEGFSYMLAMKGKDYIIDSFGDIDYERLMDIMSHYGIEQLGNNKYNLQRISGYLNSVIITIKEVIKPRYERLLSKINTATNIAKDYFGDDRDIHKSDLDIISSSIFDFAKNINNFIVGNELPYSVVDLPETLTPDNVYDLENRTTIIYEYSRDQKAKCEEQIAELKKELESIDISKEDLEWESVTYPALKKEKDSLEDARRELSFIAVFRKQRIDARLNEIDNEINLHNSSSREKALKKKELEEKLNSLIELNDVKTVLDDDKLKDIHRLSNLFDAASFLYAERDIIKDGNYLIGLLPKLQSLSDREAFKFSNMFANVILSTIRELGDKYGLRTVHNSVRFDGNYYVCHLYMTLCLANFYLNKPLIIDKFICFDEGQEYSISEYGLIFESNSSDNITPVMNIYGDINQRTSVKGITDWNQLSFISSNMFSLRENYRNSKEIVDFTNSTLRTNDIPIGIKEKIDVKELSLAEAIYQIEQGNLCIIIKENSDAYNKLKEKGALLKVEKNGNVLLTPLLAKGQEFIKVLVFNKGMTKIDKYISYTRAKRELIICKE